MLLTLVYMTGLIFRPTRRIARMGVDSLVVLVLYAVGVVGLIAIAAAGEPAISGRPGMRDQRRRLRPPGRSASPCPGAPKASSRRRGAVTQRSASRQAIVSRNRVDHARTAGFWRGHHYRRGGDDGADSDS